MGAHSIYPLQQSTGLDRSVTPLKYDTYDTSTRLDRTSELDVCPQWNLKWGLQDSLQVPFTFQGKNTVQGAVTCTGAGAKIHKKPRIGKEVGHGDRFHEISVLVSQAVRLHGAVARAYRQASTATCSEHDHC